MMTYRDAPPQSTIHHTRHLKTNSASIREAFIQFATHDLEQIVRYTQRCIDVPEKSHTFVARAQSENIQRRFMALIEPSAYRPEIGKAFMACEHDLLEAILTFFEDTSRSTGQPSELLFAIEQAISQLLKDVTTANCGRQSAECKEFWVAGSAYIQGLFSPSTFEHLMGLSTNVQSNK